MKQSSTSQLEGAVDRLLSSNAQLKDQCNRLLDERRQWQQQRHEMLLEVESVLADLETLREQQ